MDLALLTLASVFMALRSMSTLIPAKTSSQKSFKEDASSKKLDLQSNTSRQLSLLLNQSDFQNLIFATFSYLKQYPGQVATIEKVIIDPQNPEILISGSEHFTNSISETLQIIPIPEIWNNDLQSKYSVSTILETNNNLLSIQYTISHKYDQIFYLSQQYVIPLVENINAQGIELFKWSQFTNRQHLVNNTVITEDKLTKELF